MTDPRKATFDLIRLWLGRGFTEAEVRDLDARLDAMLRKGEVAKQPPEIPAAMITVKPVSEMFVNTRAPAITESDLTRAAAELRVSPAHIRALIKVESGGKGFDNRGRPIILFEPHIFHRRTNGIFSPSDFSYRQWRTKPYPRSYDGRWAQMQQAADRNFTAALESASVGLFQIMGFHWNALGYKSVRDFYDAMTKSEGAHLDAAARFIRVNGLAAKLAACRKGDPDSCRAFVKGYNGPGYEANRYHIKFSRAL